MKYVASTHGNYEFDFSRITVLLGANGSGKSTLLRAVKDALPSVYVEGGRTIQIADTVQLTRQNFNEYQYLDRALTNYRSKRKAKLVDRIFDAVMVLIRKEQDLKDTHSDAVVRWDSSGRMGEPPKREQPPLDRLFDQYTEIFPHIRLSYNKLNGSITVTNEYAATPYGPSGLSDGEKQVFSLMADMLQLEDEYSVVVVDEPELNLHPELAERLWTLLESEYQDKHFVYATHSIQFALRSNVEALYVISPNASRIRKISNLSEMPRNDLERFLGGVPGILNSATVVVTEGHEKSFDSIFYRWLLDDSKVEVFPCGNCYDVTQVIRKTGLWGQISTDIRMSGIVDADFRSEEQLSEMSGQYLVPLPLHEAESFICVPAVIATAAKRIGSQEVPLTEAEVERIIFEKLSMEKLQIALRRCFSSSTFTVRVSLEKSVLSTVTSREEAMDHIRRKSVEEISKAVEAMSEAVFEERLDTELANIKRAIVSKDVLTALKYLPGKELLALLAPKAGCKNGTDLMRSIKGNLCVGQFDVLAELQCRLQTCLAQ